MAILSSSNEASPFTLDGWRGRERSSGFTNSLTISEEDFTHNSPSVRKRMEFHLRLTKAKSKTIFEPSRLPFIEKRKGRRKESNQPSNKYNTKTHMKKNVTSTSKKAATAPEKKPAGKVLSPEAKAFLEFPFNWELLAAVEKKDIDLKEIKTEVLLAFYNHHRPNSQIEKFKDREKAIIDIADLLLDLKTPAKEKPLPKTKKTSSASEGEAKGKGQGRPRNNPDLVIVKVSKENPRKEGTHGWNSWNLLKEGMTVAEYAAAGGRGNDLRWDIDKGFVTLEEPKKK